MDKVVVITGASAGVGRALTREFAARGGVKLALLARGEAGLNGAAKDALDAGATAALPLPTDVADPAAVDAAAAKIEAELGPIDVWVNDAMVSVFAPTWEISAAEYKRVTEVNYLGTVNGTLAALRSMRPRGTGRIVQVGSALAYRGIPLQSAYCASKHAIQGFCDSLRAELLHEYPGITVTMVQLPALNTPQFSWVRSRLPKHPQPVPPIYQPEVAARAIAWAAEHGPRELNVGGPTVLTRLGNAIAPGLLDRFLARTGFGSQQTDQPVSPHRPDNVDRPLDADRDHGPHGEFDDRAKDRSSETWVATHKTGVLAGAAAGLALAAGAVVAGRR